jgi:hypothetical protein
LRNGISIFTLLFSNMAKLTDLSNELLFHIASFLMTGEDSQSLSNLCITSHRLLAIAQPALYTNVHIAELAEDPLKLMTRFLLTISECPNLAKATQELSFINDHCIRYDKLDSQDGTCPAASIYARPSRTRLPIFEELLAAAILSRLPNLKHICYTAELGASYPLLRHNHELQRDTGALAKLETFHL